MDTARQVVRWSLPGLLFVLNFVLFHALWLALRAAAGSPWAFINEANAPALIALVAGGLPAGFLFYQFYFANFRPVSRWFGFFLRSGRPHYYRADRGGNMLHTYSSSFGGPFPLLVWLDGPGTTTEGLRSRLQPPVFTRTFFGKRKVPLLLKLEGNNHLDGSSQKSAHKRTRVRAVRALTSTKLATERTGGSSRHSSTTSGETIGSGTSRPSTRVTRTFTTRSDLLAAPSCSRSSLSARTTA